jgi:hypothetical protein
LKSIRSEEEEEEEEGINPVDSLVLTLLLDDENQRTGTD